MVRPYDSEREWAMSEKAAALAERFTQLNDDLIATVERCSDAQWAAKCADTGWSVAVQAHHIAGGEASIVGVVNAIANGQQPPPVTMAQVDAGNAKHAERYANVSKEETANLLRENGAMVAKSIRGMSDEQLARTGEFLAGNRASVEQLVQFLSIGELERHGEHLHQAVAG